ncbi:uncharacterized protein VTP21DRAFT_10902 [Calcarisporiella thermophila]|uniref:uncharacterized protein n=1 Tax=Calcarisporiella thermophila TaxID=911321 RepID=UPI0037423830
MFEPYIRRDENNTVDDIVEITGSTVIAGESEGGAPTLIGNVISRAEDSSLHAKFRRQGAGLGSLGTKITEDYDEDALLAALQGAYEQDSSGPAWVPGSQRFDQHNRYSIQILPEASALLRSYSSLQMNPVLYPVWEAPLKCVTCWATFGIYKCNLGYLEVSWGAGGMLPVYGAPCLHGEGFTRLPFHWLQTPHDALRGWLDGRRDPMFITAHRSGAWGELLRQVAGSLGSRAYIVAEGECSGCASCRAMMHGCAVVIDPPYELSPLTWVNRAASLLGPHMQGPVATHIAARVAATETGASPPILELEDLAWHIGMHASYLLTHASEMARALPSAYMVGLQVATDERANEAGQWADFIDAVGLLLSGAEHTSNVEQAARLLRSLPAGGAVERAKNRLWAIGACVVIWLEADRGPEWQAEFAREALRHGFAVGNWGDPTAQVKEPSTAEVLTTGLVVNLRGSPWEYFAIEAKLGQPVPLLDPVNENALITELSPGQRLAPGEEIGAIVLSMNNAKIGDELYLPILGGASGWSARSAVLRDKKPFNPRCLVQWHTLEETLLLPVRCDKGGGWVSSVSHEVLIAEMSSASQPTSPPTPPNEPHAHPVVEVDWPTWYVCPDGQLEIVAADICPVACVAIALRAAARGQRVWLMADSANCASQMAAAMRVGASCLVLYPLASLRVGDRTIGHPNPEGAAYWAHMFGKTRDAMGDDSLALTVKLYEQCGSPHHHSGRVNHNWKLAHRSSSHV